MRLQRAKTAVRDVQGADIVVAVIIFSRWVGSWKRTLVHDGVKRVGVEDLIVV